MARLPPPPAGPTEGLAALSTLGMRIRYARCLHGIKLSELAKRTGVSNLSRIERDQTEPGIYAVHRITDTLGFDRNDSWLQHGIGEAPRAAAHVSVTRRTGEIEKVTIREGDMREVALRVLELMEFDRNDKLLDLREKSRGIVARGRDYEWWLATLLARHRLGESADMQKLQEAGRAKPAAERKSAPRARHLRQQR